MMLYVGIDPSFTKTGVCYIDTNKRLIIFKITSPEGTNVDYKAAVRRSNVISNSINRDLANYPMVSIIIEEPLSSSMKASRLGILSGILISTLVNNKNVSEIFSISPSYISWLSGPIAKVKKLNKKKASSFIASEILEHFKTELSYEVIIKNDKLNSRGKPKVRVLSHDEAEAFLLVLTLLRSKSLVDARTEAMLQKLNKNFYKEQPISQIKGENCSE